MIHRRSYMKALGLSLLVGAVGDAFVGSVSSASAAARPPRPPPEPIIWARDVVLPNYRWQTATDFAESYEEGGFDDWRLPTVDETLAATQDGSWGTVAPNSTSIYWTSDGRRSWAKAVWISTDSNGDVIPANSDDVDRIRTINFIQAKFVRP